MLEIGRRMERTQWGSEKALLWFSAEGEGALWKRDLRDLDWIS